MSDEFIEVVHCMKEANGIVLTDEQYEELRSLIEHEDDLLPFAADRQNRAKNGEAMYESLKEKGIIRAQGTSSGLLLVTEITYEGLSFISECERQDEKARAAAAESRWHDYKVALLASATSGIIGFLIGKFFS